MTTLNPTLLTILLFYPFSPSHSYNTFNPWNPLTNNHKDHVSICQTPIPQVIKQSWAFSPVASTKLAKIERNIRGFIEDYLNSMKARVQLLDSWMKEIVIQPSKSSATGLLILHENELENRKQIFSHPLRSYQLLRRFAFKLNSLVQHISGDDIRKGFLGKMNQFNRTSPLPTTKDLDDVTNSTLRIQEVYDLNVKDLIRGIIWKKKTKTGITPFQAFQIGKWAFQSQQYTQGYYFLQAALEQVQDPKNKELKIEIIANIRKLVEEHDAIHDRLNKTNYYDLPMNRFHSKIVDRYFLQTEKSTQIEHFGGTGNLSDSYVYTMSCKDPDYFQNESIKSKLYCYYERNSNPAWLINPLKIEVHSWDPYLIQIHDAIRDSAINYLITRASPELERAGITFRGLYNKPGGRQYSSTRTSSYAFLSEELKDSNTLHYLDKIVQTMTGLQVENDAGPGGSSEPIQVASYSFGGHFEEHLDAFGISPEELEQVGGDRMATFMYYLNDVELGGYTTFPKLGVAVPPIKGSAIFWFDLLKNGSTDVRTLHGGCPVAFGEKWVATKWIHYNANFQKRKCSRNPLE